MSKLGRNDTRWREDAILSAALQLAETRGWRGTTVAEIAARAGIAKGAVYKHFASKEDVYARLALDVLRGMLAHLHLLDPASPAPERLSSAARTVCHEIESAARARDILFAMQTHEVRAILSDEALTALRGGETEIDNVLREVISAGMADGSFTTGSLDTAVFTVRSALFGAVQQGWRDGTPLTADQQRALAAHLVAGLRG